MRLKRIAIALFLFAAFLFAGPELVTNGGFDSDTTGWDAYNGAQLSSVAGGYSGNCLQITDNGADNGPYTKQSSISVTAGGTIQFRVAAKRGTEDTYKINLKDTTNNSVVFTTNWATAPADWGLVVGEVVSLPANCVQLEVWILSGTQAGEGYTLFFDSVSLTEVDSGAIVFGFNWEEE